MRLNLLVGSFYCREQGHGLWVQQGAPAGLEQNMVSKEIDASLDLGRYWEHWADPMFIEPQ